jgi:hypothetical protein
LVGASQGVRKRASSRAGARRRLLTAINKGGSRVTFGESPVRSTRRQRRARGADHPQRNGMRRTSRAGDGTRPRICQSFSSACSGPESLAPAALAALRRLARLPSARPSRATRQPEPPGTYAALPWRMGCQRGPLILSQRAAALRVRAVCFCR